MTNTKSKALAEAKRLAKQHSLAQVIVKGGNGRIQEEFTDGDAPKRSKG